VTAVIDSDGIQRASIGPSGCPCEEVDVEVRDLLVAVEADVGEQAVAGRDEALVARDPADGADETGDFGVAAALRKIVPADIGALGNHEDVQAAPAG
jgi:hypothetical protein